MMTATYGRLWLATWLALALSLVAPFSQAAETVTYYYTNQQGTPLATADASGNVLTASDYRPYGSQVLGSPVGGPGYTGHVNDPDSGLVYMQARYYDPVVGRFLGVDPAGTQPGDVSKFGRFNYSSGNPVRFIDPDGKQEVDADELELETRAAMARLNPPLGPNQAAPGYVPPPAPLPAAPTFSDQIVEEELGLRTPLSIGDVKSAEPAAQQQAQRTYQTYTKTNLETGEVYSGRTSGFGTPQQNVARRDQGHSVLNARGFGPAVLQQSSTSRSAIRGQEQRLIDQYGGAQSTGGTSANAINGVSSSNPNGIQYYQDALREFGE
jgi:RHS repeat-associated protein